MENNCRPRLEDFYGDQTNSGLLVITLPEVSRYSEALNRATWPSRKTNCAPRLCRFVWTKLVEPRAGRFLESNIHTTAVGLRTAASFMSSRSSVPVPSTASFKQ